MLFKKISGKHFKQMRFLHEVAILSLQEPILMLLGEFHCTDLQNHSPFACVWLDRVKASFCNSFLAHQQSKKQKTYPKRDIVFCRVILVHFTELVIPIIWNLNFLALNLILLASWKDVNPLKRSNAVLKALLPKFLQSS